MTEKNLAEHAISARSRRNLLEAMRGEAFAFAKYKLFAKQARNNGDSELADIFDKTADQEYLEHFVEQADLLQLVGTDEQDLTNAIAGESFEVDTLYKQFAEQAREDGDEQVAHRFEEIRRDEAFHQLAFHEALIKIQTRQRIMKAATRRSSKAHDF
ncbi:MAG TPA: ferritin family protein [Candidatus Angelobacter sp.]|nr:ferritin family protein [Candidatus Angelobacter sp.]